MLFKVLEKYGKLKGDLELKQNMQKEIIESHDTKIIKNFLELYDKDVKQIHSNEEVIEKNIQNLQSQTMQMETYTNESIKIYDNLIEYFKEAGDLYNWCTILQNKLQEIQQDILKETNKTDEVKLDN